MASVRVPMAGAGGAAESGFTDLLDIDFTQQTAQDIAALGDGNETLWGETVNLSDTTFGDAEVTADGLELGISIADSAPFIAFDLDDLGLGEDDLFRIVVQIKGVTLGQVNDRFRMEVADTQGAGATGLVGINYLRHSSTSYRAQAQRVPTATVSEASGTSTPSSRVHLELRGINGHVRAFIGRDLASGIPDVANMTAIADNGVLNALSSATDRLERYLNIVLQGRGLNASAVTVERLLVRVFR